MEGHIRIRNNFKSSNFLPVVFFGMFVHTAVCHRDSSHWAYMTMAWNSISGNCEFCLFLLKQFKDANRSTS